MEYKISEKMKNIKPSAIREIFKSLSDPTVISFAAGNPSPDTFPIQLFSQLSAEIYRDNPILALQYGITEGYPPLVEKVSHRLYRSGIGRSFDSTIITTGGQQGIDLTSKVLCNEGDVVLCEKPSFIGALNAFRANGAEVTGIDMDDDGINTEALEMELKRRSRVKLLYLIPTFQNPSGLTLSLEKRKIIYNLALKYGIIILEDNPYGELRYRGDDIPTIKSMDEAGIVAYCSSFSKILAPAIRVGTLTAPAELISKVVVAKQVNDVHTNMYFQLICNNFLEQYDLDSHISELRGFYCAKLDLILKEMDNKFAGKISYTRPEGGLFLWCGLPDGIELSQFVKAALAKKVAVVPGTAFLPDMTEKSNSFRVNFSMPSDGQIVKGIDVIAELCN